MEVSLIQARMSLERSLLSARIVTFVFGFFAVGNLASNSLAPDRWSEWSIGLTVTFIVMAVYGVLLWRKARGQLKNFEDQNGRDAGRRE
jgi:uncharacterized integral membrane protein